MIFKNNKHYDALVWIAQILLPAVAALYINLADYWNLAYPEQISGTIMAVDLFLGIILGISKSNYNKKLGGES